MDALINAFVVLFIVLDPVGVAWLFASMTHRYSRVQQRQFARRGVMLATVILVVFYFTGETVLHLLGISMPAFRVAGGILLFLIAIDMVFARQSGLRSTTAAEQAEAETKTDLSVFPLAFPLIAGPGGMTTVILMGGDTGAALMYGGQFAVLLSVLVMVMAALRLAPVISGQLGETGANVISRLLGLILAALAAQYVLDVVRESLAGS